MPSLLTGSAVSKAKVVFRGMLLSMPSYTGAVNVPSSLEPTDPMVVPLSHGSLASVLFGTLLVWTPLQPHTYLMQRGKLDL